jgi:hypothetical protein
VTYCRTHVSDEEYIARVRRHTPSVLIPLVAPASARHEAFTGNVIETGTPSYRPTQAPPGWATM